MGILAAGIGLASWLCYGEWVQQEALLKQLNETGEQLALECGKSEQANTKLLLGIAHYACLNRYLVRDQAVLSSSQQIHQRTQTLANTLLLMRRGLRTGQPTEALARLLPTQLNYYTAFIQQFVPEVPALTKPQTATKQTGWFGQFNLEKLPLTAALAMLTQLEVRVRDYESQALSVHAQKVGTNSMWSEVIRPMVVPVAETVEPGATYQARLFLAQYGQSDYCNMQMRANGEALTERTEWDRIWPTTGMQVKFEVPPPQPGQPDTVRAAWHGSIRDQTYRADTVFQLEVPYLIVKRPAQ